MTRSHVNLVLTGAGLLWFGAGAAVLPLFAAPFPWAVAWLLVGGAVLWGLRSWLVRRA